MKTAFTFTQLRFVRLSWYISLALISFITVQNSCSCRINDDLDHLPPAPSLAFAKLSYDRNNKRLVVIIKNTGKVIAKDLSFRCVNISEDEVSRTAVLFDQELIATIPVKNLAAGASTPELYLAVDFQTAKEALVQVNIISGQQEVKADAIQINLCPTDLLSIGDAIIIVKPGEMGEFRWKLIIDEQVGFNTISLKVEKNQGADIDVFVEGTPILLTKSINEVTLTGADLKQLVKQKEILVKVKNNTNIKVTGIHATLSENAKDIAMCLNYLAKDIEGIFLPAIIVGNVDLVEQAIANGSDVNAQNTRYESALYLAAEHDHQAIVKILLKHGARSQLYR